MSDARWPESVRPLTNKNYSFNRGVNVKPMDVAGGLPRVARDFTLDTPTFKLNFRLSKLGMSVIDYFYNVVIGGGSFSFFMNLDSGDGIKEHYGMIVPGSWNVSRPNDGNWYLSFDFRVEYLPQERDEQCSNLYDLYLCYGDNLICIIRGLDELEAGWPSA